MSAFYVCILGACEEGEFMSHTISAALKNLILEKASQGKLSHRSGETNVFVHNKY